MTVENSIKSFWKVTFSTCGSVCLKFFLTVLSETMLKKKNNLPNFVNMNLLFLLAVYTNSLVGSFSWKYVTSLWSLIWETRITKLKLNHLIENNRPEFCNELVVRESRKKIVRNFVSGQHCQNHPESVILQMYQSFSSQSFKNNSVHIPSSKFHP